MNRVSAMFTIVYVFLLSQVHAVGSKNVDNSVLWDSLSFLRSDLDRITFQRILDDVFVPFGGTESFLEIEDGGIWVSLKPGEDEMEFFPFASIKPLSRSSTRLSNSVEGLRIALDPGHIGGAWGVMEERSFTLDGGSPVQEGDVVLATAKRLKLRLEALGATVWLTRSSDEPVTDLRPDDFIEEATAFYENEIGLTKEERREVINMKAERLFYRKAEIEDRAYKLNTEFKPDLAIALHCNAAGWDDPENPELVDVNDGHILVHGAYLADELEDEAMRFQMLSHISKQYYQIEVPLAKAMADAMKLETNLQPYEYSGENAKLLNDNEYVWSRNLLANRIFDCPIVYLEPWVLNSKEVYPWVREGDYEGLRLINGVERFSLPRVYSDFVVEGLLDYFERVN